MTVMTVVIHLMMVAVVVMIVMIVMIVKNTVRFELVFLHCCSCCCCCSFDCFFGVVSLVCVMLLSVDDELNEKLRQLTVVC